MRRLPIILAAVALLAGCGSSSKKSSTTSSAPTGVDKQAAAQVPAGIKSKGTLTVAADATYAPNEFIAPNGHTVEGMDADLAQALTSAMGLRAKVVNATF